MFKKAVFFLFFLLVLLPSSPTMAQYGLDQAAPKAGYTDTRNVYQLIDTGVSVFLSIIAILLFAFMLYGGIRWMTAQGREEEVNRAKDTIEQAAIGLGIILVAYAATYFIFNRLIGG